MAVPDVNEVVLQMQGVLARILGDRIRVSLRLDAVDGLAEVEAVQLEWVLLNLAANSRDAMPEGGLIHDIESDRTRTRVHIYLPALSPTAR